MYISNITKATKSYKSYKSPPQNIQVQVLNSPLCFFCFSLSVPTGACKRLFSL